MDEGATSDDPSSKHHSRMEDWYDEDIKTLKSVAARFPVVTWDLFIPHIERLTKFQAEPYDHRLEKWFEDRDRRHSESHVVAARGVVEMFITAGKEMARKQTEELLTRTAGLEDSLSPIVQEILMSVYADLPKSHADIGIRWLLADMKRVHIGSSYDEPEWTPAMGFVSSLSAFCSERLFRDLEEAIVNYHSPDEIRLAKYYLRGWRDGYYGDYWGRTQHFLLPALHSVRMHPTTTRLIEVLKRKYANYPEERFLRAGRISGGLIGSKLDRSLEKISDRAWLEIVRDKGIAEENHNWKQVDENHAVTSSIWQFSRSLGNMAKRFPERFGQLSLRFPDDIHPQYVSAILYALGQKEPKSDIPEGERSEWHPACVETVEDVIERFQSRDDRETALSFCRLISWRAEEQWSARAIERVIRYARSHPDPELDTLNVHCDKTATVASVEMLFQNTINCVRGVAAEAIGQLLWRHTSLFEKLKPGIESLVNDSHPAVRMASIDALLPVLNIQKDQAVAWFCKACQLDLRIAASPRAVLFFNYTVNSHFNSIAPLISSMLHSHLDEVSQKGAEEVTARWLFHGLFEEELAECQKKTISQRKGIAQVVAHFFNDKKYSARCKQLLTWLLDDPEKSVRVEALNAFRRKVLRNESIDKEFLETYIRSKAFADDPSVIVYWIKEFPDSLVSLANTIFVICEVFSTTLREKSREVGSRVPHAVSDVCSLLLRLYEQSQASSNAEIANRCLDIWDMLFENRVGIIRELTRAIDA